MGAEERSVDPAIKELLKVSQSYETVWDRLDSQTPHCKFGLQGVCCRNCIMGPCRISQKTKFGVCGANEDTIVARNVVRAIAAGVAAHSDHARAVAILLAEIASGENQDYRIADPEKLKAVAGRLGLETQKEVLVLAKEVAGVAMEDFGRQAEEPLEFLKSYVPPQRLKRWQELEKKLYKQTAKKMGILPRNIDREIAESLHRTTMGVDHDPLSLLLQGVRTSLADGWGGSLMATELQDIIFGTPRVRAISTNLGVLSADKVNIVIHGHEPILSEKIVEMASRPEMEQLAHEVGAEGINVVGICCTGNEILMRQGVPVAGNELHQEMAILTGAVEAMVVDVQCIYPALGKLAKCFHTKFISTSDRAKFPESLHIQFEEKNANEVARKIVETAIRAFPLRNKNQVNIPAHTSEAIVGFSNEALIDLLGGSLTPLIEAMISGDIKGVVGIVGCNNPKVKHDYHHITLTQELIKRDILVIGTGCWAIAAAKAGLMRLQTQEISGPGLKKVCKALKIPPVIHMGSCVDCSRMLNLAGALASYLKSDISDLPLVGSAPEWTTEKAMAIGTYFIASGIPVHLWPIPPVTGSQTVVKMLTEDIKDLLGGYFFLEEDPLKTVDLMEEIILQKRKALGWKTD